MTATAYVAAAALGLDGRGPAPSSSADRAILEELLQARTALGRFGVNVNQAVQALNSGAGAPVWLLAAVSGCVRSSERIDDVTVQLARRLR